MSKYKLTFKLKQHTPIIHFQHDQHGATLRATELKPKLDRFLIEKLDLTTGTGDNERPKDEYKNWFINQGKEHLALDYKVRILPENELSKEYYLFFSYLNNNRKNNLRKHFNDKVKVIAPSPYFANNDKVKFYSARDEKNGEGVKDKIKKIKIDELNFAIMQKGLITLEIVSFHKKLSEEIPKNIFEFFASTNFGNRQNKGFGSFSVNEINDIEINKTSNKNLFSKVWNYVFYVGNANNIETIFKTIDSHYKLLKNKAGDEIISKIRDFYKDKGIIWEKPAITKKLIFNNNIDDLSNYSYVRALLGLAELHDYVQQKKKVKISHDYKDKKEQKDKIERFQSPIWYKVTDNEIFLVALPKYRLDNLDKIGGKEFWFYTTDKLEQANEEQKLKLSVPTDFELERFLNFALKNQS